MNNQKNTILFTSKEEFESLFRENYSNLCSYANKFIRDVDASEEVVQEVFFKLWNNRESIEISSSIQSYLFRAVRNSSLNLIKHINIREEYKAHNEREIAHEEASYEDRIVATELENKIRETINQIPTERRKIFIMSRYDGLKYKEIAEKLSISVKTVENQMGKAIKYMRDNLTEYISVLILVIITFINKYLN